jgi:hypothetical protein
MKLNNSQIIDAINLLNDADGEDLQFILNKIGMDDQILKQLIMTSSDLNLSNALDERNSFELDKQFTNFKIR